MSDEHEDRATVMRRAIKPEGQDASGGRDDRTRVRMPSLGSESPAERGGAAPTRAVPRQPAHERAESGHSGRTVRMKIAPQRFGWLIVKSGARIGQVYPLGDVTDLGRGAGNDIVIDDERVSEQHARVRVDDEGRFVVWDLASTNGTTVNGQKILAATPVVENDEIKLGQTVLVLKTLDVAD